MPRSSRSIAPEPDGDRFVDRLARIDPDQPDPRRAARRLPHQATARRARPCSRRPAAALIPDIAQRARWPRRERLERLHGELVARRAGRALSEALLDVVAAISAHYEAAQARPLAARFRRPDREARRRCSTTRRRAPGCATSSMPASPTSSSTRARTPTREQWEVVERAGRRVLRRRQRRRPAAHAVRGGRPEAVDLLVPGRRPGAVRRCRPAVMRSAPRAVQLAVRAGAAALPASARCPTSSKAVDMVFSDARSAGRRARATSWCITTRRAPSPAAR